MFILRYKPIYTKCLVLIMFAINLVDVVYGLSTDHQQNIEIEADNSELNRNDSTVTYHGNVIITRGSIRMTGDSMIVTFNQDHAVERIIINGTPATYQQLPDDSDIYDEASAMNIEYATEENNVVLMGNATFKKQDIEFEGDSIEYNILQNKVKMNSGSDDRIKVRLKKEMVDDMSSSKKEEEKSP